MAEIRQMFFNIRRLNFGERYEFRRKNKNFEGIFGMDSG